MILTTNQTGYLTLKTFMTISLRMTPQNQVRTKIILMIMPMTILMMIMQMIMTAVILKVQVQKALQTAAAIFL